MVLPLGQEKQDKKPHLLLHVNILLLRIRFVSGSLAVVDSCDILLFVSHSMTKMILCVVFVLLISVPEGCLQSASTDVSSTTLSTFKTNSHNLSSPTARSNSDKLTTTTSTDDSSAIRSTTDHSTDDRSTTDTTGSEYASRSQTTPLDFKSTTAQQTTQMDVTKRNQTTLQFTSQLQKSTVLKTPESTNETAFPTGQNSTTSSTALENKGGHDVAGNPGLIAVLCIFFITLAVLLVIVIVKVVRARRPQFERLDDVPMGNISEDAPFARYPPK
ncbi:putative mucin-5AC-like [Triplophysa rosa]|uniref:Mucin-5AC-like n=1 Tax=Triplophysa rosa TaxID=992332 RepID=A0A9W7TG59_TRIRA|nr:putative mucin-5AC-like [Triplophysa rosa]